MKKLILSLFVCFAAVMAKAQIKATTEEGRSVILKQDGTWSYDSTTVANADSGVKVFTKPAVDTKCLKSEKVSYDFCYNPAAWQISGFKLNQDAEFSLVHKKGDAYAMIITERIGFELEMFKNALVERLKSVSSESTVLLEERVVVNGIPAYHVRAQAKLEGLVFMYDSYYISDENGAIQLTAFTGKNIFKQYEKDFIQLLNGITRRMSNAGKK